ncbi:hypothetical protein IJF91_02745 [Candidatus Saccharibacteria bacterium]|nr:hypothetical protein [Candidatus Saccharibacteria bacterium]
MKSSAYAYDYTGGEQTFTAPCGGYYKLEVWGASGADGWNSWTTKIYQKTLGKGAYVAGSIKVNKNNPLYIYVGGAATKLTGYSDAPGGYNGGGGGCKAVDGDDAAGAGGGSTDIRVISGEWNDDNSLRSRILVAGGGGGSHLTLDTATLYEQGRHAGGISVVGQISGKTDSDIWSPTVNQTTGGAFGYGATGICPSGAGHSGGGGGWYGGEAKSTGNENDGAGGSSYISGHTGAVGVTSTSDSSPKTGCTTGTTNNTCSLTPYINPATGTYYTFTNTVMIDGAGYAWTNTKGSLQQMPNPSGGYYASGVGHSGNGYAKITYLGTTI